MRRLLALTLLLGIGCADAAVATPRPVDSVREAQTWLGLKKGRPAPIGQGKAISTSDGDLGLAVVGALPLGANEAAIGPSTVVAEQVGQGVRASVVVPGPAAPMSYAFSVAGASRLELQADGSVLVYRGSSVAGQIHRPWAVDANGRALATHFAIVGTTVVQSLDDVSQITAYPVVMDPDLAPGCVTFSKGGVLGTTVTVRNGCRTTQRVKLVVAFGPDSSCVVLGPGKTFKHDALKPDRLERC